MKVSGPAPLIWVGAIIAAVVVGAVVAAVTLWRATGERRRLIITSTIMQDNVATKRRKRPRNRDPIIAPTMPPTFFGTPVLVSVEQN